MKTASEYRSLAWQDLRAMYRQSSLIMLVTMLVGMIAVSILYGSLYWYNSTQSIIAGMVTVGVALLVILTVGLLNYYMPVWFMSLVRKQPEPWYEAKTSYGRALLATLIMLIPSIVEEALTQPINMSNDPSPVLLLIFLVLWIPMMLFIIWWTYAVSTTLPYRVYDDPNRSVLEAVRDNIAMMRGYKFKLFCVDFLVAVWPLAALFVMIIIMAVALGVVMALSPGTSTMWMVMGMSVILFPFVLVIVFITQPMLYFAHARFYNDLRAELEPAVEEQPSATNI